MMQSFKHLKQYFIVHSKKDRTFRHTSHLIKTVFPSFLLIPLLILILMTTTGMVSPNRISTDRPLLIGGNKDFAPFEFQNSEGMPDGFTIDLMKAVARKEGLNIKFELGIWSDARDKLEEARLMH